MKELLYPQTSVLIKPASGNCNMHCDYCFYADEASKRSQAEYGFMSNTTLKNVIRKMLSCTSKSCTIAFQGGEPTLCGIDFFKRVIDLTRRCNINHADIHFAFQTNGILIDDKWAQFLAQNHFLVGLSLDGTKGLNDAHRHFAGGSAYENVIRAARTFDLAGVEYNILTVVNKETALHVDEIYEFYKKNHFTYLQFINCLDPLGEPHGQREWSLTPKLYGEFLIKLFNMWYDDFQLGNQPYIRIFENYIEILCGYPPESCEQRGSCQGSLVVEADGSVYPCDFYVLDLYRLGNFNTDNVSAFFKRLQQTDFMKRSLNYPDKCKNCKWGMLCRDGCYRSRRLEQEGEEGLNYFCEGYQMFFEACGDRLITIANNIAANQTLNQNFLN